jgi:hypothetical protein
VEFDLADVEREPIVREVLEIYAAASEPDLDQEEEDETSRG